MGHNRKLVMGGSALTNARLRGNKTMLAANIVRDEIEKEMIESGYLDHLNFTLVSLMIRYGLKYDIAPEYSKSTHGHNDLALAIEVDTHDMLEANQEQMNTIFRKAALRALVHAGDKYGLKNDRLKMLLADLD